MKPKYSYKTLTRAQSLRRDMTDAEIKLWSILRSGQLGGAKFRRQQPIGPFIVDFVCQQHRLIVEADGSQHCESESDVKRDAFLRAKGYRVMRFWNHDVLGSIEAVGEEILRAVSGPLPPTAARRAPPSPSGGEGALGQAPHP
jgi:very-short-patch-repair endonuclease